MSKSVLLELPAQRAILFGMNALADAVGATLGPCAGHVLIDQAVAAIARRFVTPRASASGTGRAVAVPSASAARSGPDVRPLA